MKKNVIAFIVMVAMLTATFLTGCDTKDMNTDTATIDQVVATADETSPTEDATDTETEAQTEAPTEKSTETDKKKSDKDAEDNEEENENEGNGTGSASNTSNNSSSGSNTTTTNKKPNSNNNSSSNTTKPNNNSGSNSSNNKPSNNSGSNNNSNNKPNTNNNNSGSTNTKPEPTPVITDDTPLSHDQLCTDANMQKVTSAVNNYFSGAGMIYNPSLNKYNSGWFYCYTDSTDAWSVNEYTNRILAFFESEANAFLNMYDSVYSDLTFYCYAERRSDGEYDIYFCHE